MMILFNLRIRITINNWIQLHGFQFHQLIRREAALMLLLKLTKLDRLCFAENFLCVLVGSLYEKRKERRKISSVKLWKTQRCVFIRGIIFSCKRYGKISISTRGKRRKRQKGVERKRKSSFSEKHVYPSQRWSSQEKGKRREFHKHTIRFMSSCLDSLHSSSTYH